MPRDKVVNVVIEGVRAAYQKKFPGYNFSFNIGKLSGDLEVFVEKRVVETVSDEKTEISLRKARSFKRKISVGDLIKIPFSGKIGRIEILVAKQIIAAKISELEQSAVYREFESKKGTLLTGVIYKKERAGFAVNVGDTMALLPRSGFIPGEQYQIGSPIKALLKEVLRVQRGGYQLILDRASAEFVRLLIKFEIPEVFEGVVEIKRIERIAGYKTKLAVSSNDKEIDPVGTCIGLGGSRIRPILREIGNEKIDLIRWSESPEQLVKDSLKPASVDRVEILDNKVAVVWLDEDQRSFAIGRMGQNIQLASMLTGYEISLKSGSEEAKKLLADEAESVPAENSDAGSSQEMAQQEEKNGAASKDSGVAESSEQEDEKKNGAASGD